MTVIPVSTLPGLLEEQLAQASPDLLRELLTTFVTTLTSAEADSVFGAAYGTVSPDRINRRRGYRTREFDTRVGTLDLAVPKLRQSSNFPEWLLECCKRAERALTSVAVPAESSRAPILDVQAAHSESSVTGARTADRRTRDNRMVVLLILPLGDQGADSVGAGRPPAPAVLASLRAASTPGRHN